MDSVVSSIGDRGTPGRGRPGADHPRGEGGRHGAATEAPFAEHHGHDGIDDVTLVMGMPDGAVPQPLQARFVALMQEIERLRAELEQARRHEALLREQADHHPFLGILHRRAFLRELSRLLVQAERAGMPGSLLTFHLAGLEALRENQGVEAADAALAHMVAVLRSAIDPLDPIGYLDAGDFAIALAMFDDDEAAGRERRLMERLAATPFLWNGTRPVLSVSGGRAAFAGGIKAEEVLRAADEARRDRH